MSPAFQKKTELWAWRVGRVPQLPDEQIEIRAHIFRTDRLPRGKHDDRPVGVD
jgi:hypothetical protein